jgi:hypothetical protein
MFSSGQEPAAALAAWLRLAGLEPDCRIVVLVEMIFSQADPSARRRQITRR